MHPGNAGSGEFDLIAVPRHDRIADRPNVFRITGAPHRVTKPMLEGAADDWRDKFAHLPRPWIGLLGGGATRRRKFSGEMARELAEIARRMAIDAGGALLVTTSRRTGAAADALMAAIGAPGGPPFFAHDWRNGADNPYFGFLALADGLIVTGDSVSMVSEACGNSGPVFIYAPPGFATAKHQRLHRELFDLDYARPLGDRFTTWRHEPLNAAEVLAGEIRARLDLQEFGPAT